MKINVPNYIDKRPAMDHKVMLPGLYGAREGILMLRICEYLISLFETCETHETHRITLRHPNGSIGVLANRAPCETCFVRSIQSFGAA